MSILTLMLIALASSAVAAVPPGGSLVPPLGQKGRPAASPQATDVVKIELAGRWRDADGRVIVGVRFTMAPKWHIYWSNPGDSGLAPRFTLTLPEGWSNGEAIFPRPDVIAHDGETNFGYDDGAVVLVPLTARQGATGSRATIAARYLVCKGVCLSGEGRIEFDVPEPSAIAMLPMVPQIVEGRSIPQALSAIQGRASVVGDRLRIEAVAPILKKTEVADGEQSQPANGFRQIQFLPFDLPGFTLVDEPFFRGQRDSERIDIAIPVSLNANDAPSQELVAGGLMTVGASRSDPCFHFTVQVSRAPAGR